MPGTPATAGAAKKAVAVAHARARAHLAGQSTGHPWDTEVAAHTAQVATATPMTLILAAAAHQQLDPDHLECRQSNRESTKHQCSSDVNGARLAAQKAARLAVNAGESLRTDQGIVLPEPTGTWWLELAWAVGDPAAAAVLATHAQSATGDLFPELRELAASLRAPWAQAQQVSRALDRLAGKLAAGAPGDPAGVLALAAKLVQDGWAGQVTDLPATVAGLLA